MKSYKIYKRNIDGSNIFIEEFEAWNDGLAIDNFELLSENYLPDFKYDLKNSTGKTIKTKL